MELKDKKVLIAIPCYSGYIPTLTVSSLLQLHKPCPCAFIVIDRQRIDKCRNFFIKEALKGDFDYLLMIDDDNPTPPGTLEMLLEDDKDIVIPPILSRNPNKEGQFTLCAYYKEDRLVKTETLAYYNHITKFVEEGHLHKIDAGGCGVMLIKKKVLEKMDKEYEYPFAFGDTMVEGQRRTMSEDVEFCERAVRQGFEVWLDERIVPIHLGNKRVIKYKQYG